MDQEKTYKWIQDRIHDLHAGTLTAEDRLRMEELAKTDPFVQDAMEGYQANPDHDHSVLLKVIADRIQQKNASRRPKILPLSKGWIIPAVAASLVLILATWAVMFYIEKQGDAVFVAAEPNTSSAVEHSTEVQLTEADSLTDDFSASSSSVAGNDNGQTAVKEDVKRESEPSLARKESGQKTKSEKDNLNTPIDDAKHIDGNIASEEVKDNENEISNEPVVTSPAPPATQPAGRSAVEMSADKSMAAGATSSKLNSKKDEGYYANQMSPDIMAMRVAGKVIDEITGEPILFAAIHLSNTNLFELTDVDGNFDFYIPDTVADVIINYTGYPLMSANIAQGNTNIILKLKSSQTDDVYILKPGQISPSDEETYRSLRANIRFSEYLNANTLLPLANTFDPTVKMVKLEFNVAIGQKMARVKVLASSGGKKYEEEAIRLLKMGPAWSCADGKYPCKLEYTIYFK
ncbi:MAG: carboxypeptidase-like regulatory domain-containing protein [Saprospiraceae bacterium]